MGTENSPLPLPFFFVGKATTKERIQHYAAKKHPLLSQNLGKPDTKSIWYSKEHITLLLKEIEHAGGDGLRVYLGMYEPSHEFAGQLCLVMNVTRELQSGDVVSHVNVVLENEPDFAVRSAQPRSGNSERDFNYGSPCPPRCDPGNPGDPE